MPRRVVITGMGAVNACGNTVAETWDNIINGRSGIGPITGFDPANFAVKIAAEVKKTFDPTQYLDFKEVRRTDRHQHFAMAAAKQALAQSGLAITEANAERVAVIVSSAIGGCKAFEDGVRALDASGPRRVDVFLIPKLMSNGAGGLIAIQIGARGPNFSVASACASGQDGIGQAWQMIRHGVCDAALAGASEASLIEIGIAAFDRTSAMTHRTDGVPQPFDKERDGLVMGEGAAVIVLEALEHAQARGAEILGELAGYAATADAYHITAPSDTGVPGAHAMRRALESAGVNLEAVGYINAHGTGTVLNDAAETQSIKRAFGPRAYQVPVSSTKSMTGHMMGATGALETVLCVQAIRQGALPPTLNYRTPDPACDLDYIPNTAREAAVEVCMTNAFGFGGHNSVLVVKRFVG